MTFSFSKSRILNIKYTTIDERDYAVNLFVNTKNMNNIGH